MARRSLPDLVLAELNLSRTNPSKYSEKLAATLKYYKGNVLEKPGQVPLETEEGPANVEQLIAYLKTLRPSPPLKASPALANAAQVHADDIGPKGLMGHVGSDGFETGERVERFGQWEGSLAETIEYGSSSAEDIVLSLLIDDGVSNRAHRLNILNPDHLFVGVGHGRHTEFENVTVITFGERIQELSSPVKGSSNPSKKEEIAAPPKKEENKPAPKKEEIKPAPKKEEIKPVPKKDDSKAKPSGKTNKFNPSDYERPGLSLDEIEEIKEAFDLFDTDGSGTVEPKELKAAMESLGFEAKNATLFHLVSDLDEDGSNTIDFNEFLDLMSSQVSETDTKAEIYKIFTLFDVDKTNHINIKNLKKIAKDLGETLNDDDLLDLIQKGDSDGDGQVSFEDFYNIMTKKFN